MKKGIIYMWTCNINGKSYIGQSNNKKRRYKQFMNIDLPYAGLRINNARKKYGVNNFSYKVLLTVECECNELLKIHLNRFEKLYIEKYDTFKNGYNSRKGGFQSLGYNHTPETCAKISSVHKGKVVSDETRQKMSNAHKGKEVNMELITKLAELNKGKKHTAEVRKNISDRVKKYWSEENRQKRYNEKLEKMKANWISKNK